MQQKVQFVACLIHDPAFLILDEPFQGLDPVNVELLKGLMRLLAGEGKSIVLSAHQMNLVEELCDRILLINEGKPLLYGSLQQIKRDFAPNSVRGSRRGYSTGPARGSFEASGMATLRYSHSKGTQRRSYWPRLWSATCRWRVSERASVPLNDIFVAMVQGSTDSG